MKYRKRQETQVLGLLYIVEVRAVHKTTGEKAKHKLLMVGCEADDIERKLRWVFDATQYVEFSVSSIEKVREKIHTLSVVVTQEKSQGGPVIERADGTSPVPQTSGVISKYGPKLYAVGVSTTVLAADESHATRKVGNALIASVSPIKSGTSAKLSEDSIVVVEEISLSSGYAKHRDISSEINRARMVSGGAPS